MKKSFIIHLDSLDILDELSIEQAGKLLHAFRDFHNEIEPDLESILRIVFLPFKKQFQRDLEKYDATIIRNSLNGSKGGRPKKPTKTKQNQENPVGILALTKNPTKPKKADNDNDSVNGNDNDNGSDSVKDSGNVWFMGFPAETPKKKFIKPSIEDICLYVQSKEPMADKILIQEFSEKFHSFYESNGWKVGKNPMKNWKAAIGTWSDTLKKTLNPFKESSAKESFPSGAKKGSWESRQMEYLKGVQSILNDDNL
jgi:hypothetical protein